ncbi:SDR family NAD(P)-dependent oxidoreductase [Desulfovibrio litoralis]|uniref:3-oxoacyl-[acyl-carrier protein] reductase n=1 Tax=Desulfovibrio litoralis DSM 11393 TaxID=1121455 RepID=A0A1M7T295_9BACT|nr:SDR family oxidoreductase [Desulfovibrio litoralis]SHN64819.1 3-oxoacyl-[acyl-carrier protein] reductase [Desulfovibrio litoralis DSM 11393]
MKLEQAKILVTGGAQGLGYAIATHLQSCGAFVIIADCNAEALKNLPSTFELHALDVTSPEQAQRIAKHIVAEHGHIDVLVNNAGVIFSEPFVNIMNPQNMMHDYQRFSDSLKVNLDSVFIMTSAVVEQMVLKRTKGVIINISSISAHGNEGQTAYSAAKAGVNAMTATWAKELGRYGIRCNAVAPGFIGTDSTKKSLSEPILKHIMSNTPLRRLGEPYEVAKAVACLIENDFINGAILPVDGGLVI